VIAIIPTADRQRATVEVRVGFDALDPRILPDMGVKVAFQDAAEASAEQRATAGFLLPAGAIRREQGRAYVFVVNEGVAERRAVAAGADRAGEVLVQAGLEPGERVVVSGPPQLRDGTPVRETNE